MVEWIYKLTDISSIKRITFRQDINGLRAIAVLAVVFYHAELELFKGGWLGVDVFFVISGYLISNIIISELNEGTFSFKNFYLRRVKRILPALFSTLLLTIPLAYFYLTPKVLQEYIDSLIASVFFYANYHFMNLDFYVAESTKLMPLLHTWSLAIEEQYYLLFPLLAFLVYKYFKKYFTFFIGFIIVGSLYLNTLSQSSDKFYRLEFRIWELLLGVLIMILSNNLKIKHLEKIGLPLMLFPIVYFGDSWINDVEPKLIALIGIALIIFSNTESSILTKVLSYKLISIIGLSSYSIYLLHQPIFAFFNINKQSQISNYLTNQLDVKLYEKLYLLIGTLIFGFFSYHFIEKYFLKNNKFKTLFFIFVLTLTAPLLVNEIVRDEFNFNDTYEYNFNSEDGELCLDKEINNLCKLDSGASNTIYLIGDSSLATISKTLFDRYSVLNNFNFIDVTGRGCLFLFEVIVDDKYCGNFNKIELDNFVSEINNSIIIYSARLPYYESRKEFDLENKGKEVVFYPDNIEINFKEEIYKTINALIKNNNQIILIYPTPEFPFNVPRVFNNVYSRKDFTYIGYPEHYWNSRKEVAYKIYNNLSQENIFRIFPDEIFCDSFVKNECVGTTSEQLFFIDGDHLSIDGANLITDEIVKILETVAKKNS